MHIIVSVAKRRIRRKIQETKKNFEGTYLSDGLADSLKWEVPTPREFTQQKWLISGQALSSYGCMETAFFLVPVKYAFVCCMPALPVLSPGPMKH